MSEQRVLPADVYDTLELAALEFGGIGAGPHFEYGIVDGHLIGWNRNCPVCAHGLLVAAVGTDDSRPYSQEGSPSRALMVAGVDGFASDRAVYGINARKRTACNARVGFDEWCKATRIVRGN